uniref:Carn_acyltransf domain-containing protein n=1 Tax=Angiostrongylus cantonensis TaxID=6313 RepID=A0A0K0DFS5_ANGCA
MRSTVVSHYADGIRFPGGVLFGDVRQLYQFAHLQLGSNSILHRYSNALHSIGERDEIPKSTDIDDFIHGTLEILADLFLL